MKLVVGWIAVMLTVIAAALVVIAVRVVQPPPPQVNNVTFGPPNNHVTIDAPYCGPSSPWHGTAMCPRDN